ncbi:MAG: cobyric acid synthase, partial [Atopobiaceae bacterium]|nr:cobyric acid synthase [Atopobiaceae bacterium]
QLIGTLMLLEDDERRLVKATVVNKFRGDPTLFADGMRILRERTGLPVAGLVPFWHLDLDDEDSVSDRLDARASTGLVDVAVVRLPKISNFTDFVVLDAMDDMSVRYVSKPSDLGRPDLIIIPGTKATMADLLWMRTSGMESAVIRAAHAGVTVLGICGGYQMLGRSIDDPSGVEGMGTLAGMGLLPVRTVFGADKRTTQVTGAFCQVDGPLSALSGASVVGYEIHQGTTERLGGKPLVSVRDKLDANCKVETGRDTTGAPTTVSEAAVIDAAQPSHEDGCQQGNVYGSYLHGIFDDPAANRALVSALLSAKGLDPNGAQSLDMAEYRQRQYDMLADGIRRHMDLDLVYRIIEEGA